jgi:hypothetical protein
MHGNRVALLALLLLAVLGAGCKRALTEKGPGSIGIDAGTSADATPGDAAPGDAAAGDATAPDVTMDVLGFEIISIPPHDPNYVCPTAVAPGLCPADAPMTGPCQGAWTCEDGDRIDVNCRRRWACSGGAATVSRPCSDGGFICPPVAQSGTACGAIGGLCSYADGSFCRCDFSGNWVCASAPIPAPSTANCPAQVPFAGTACDQDLIDCMYGGCDGYIAACCGGVWIVRFHACIIPV